MYEYWQHSVKKVYKAVRLKDGALESLVVGSARQGYAFPYSTLTYIEGEITYAPKGSDGIYVSLTLEGAVGDIRGNCPDPDEGHVYEATPLGKQGKGMINLPTYPAILLGKCVWRSEPEKPKEEWVDITKECHTTLVPFEEIDGSYLALCHASIVIGVLALNQNILDLGLPSNYKIERAINATCSFKVFKKIR